MIRIIRRDPSRAYLDRWLWIPKCYVDVNSVKSALTYEVASTFGAGKTRLLYLWKETQWHLLIPRAFWDPMRLPCPVVDCRPRKYTEVDFKSHIKLDHRLKQIDGKKLLLPTGDDVQQKSIRALDESPGGVLKLACVAGDTVIQVNRGGKGFRTTIKKAYEATMSGRWDEQVPTRIHSNIGDHIGLNEVLSFVQRGLRVTFKLTLSDGKELRLTEDHEVLTPSGYVQLQWLRPGSTVVTEGSRRGSARKEKVAYRRIGGFKHHPYARYQSRSYCIEEHRAVAEASLNGMPLAELQKRCSAGTVQGLAFIDPSKFHVHHKDGNIRNNLPSNLEVLRKDEHLRKHRPGAQAFGFGELHYAQVVSIEEYGAEVVYDVACVAPHNNFVANGIVVHNCGKGKTVVALEKIARGRVPALVMLDNTQLLYQWKQEAEALLSVPGGIGIYGDGKKEWQKGLVLATYHSIANWADTIPEEARRWFGQIFWDEGHHCPAPLFSRTADMFYGARYSLTATPERDDGLHVLSEGHIGPVLYTDLTPTMQPSLAFMWTGMSLDLRDASVASKVIDINGEVHTSKLYSYFGQWAPRVNILLKTIYEARQSGRMVLVLSNSVDEVVNLMSCWERPGQPLYTDIPVPTPAEVGEQLNPVKLTNKDVTRIEKRLKTLRAQLQKASPTDAPVVQADINQLEQSLRQFDVHKKIQAELSKRQRKYISALVRESKDAGMLTYEVDPKTRQKFLAERNVIFAITKYGKEGMDCPRLDTVILSALFSNRNGLQQLMGRPTRPMPGKKTPVLLAMVDDIGQCIGMARKLMNHLRSWPSEEGGPYDPVLIGFPTSWRTKTRTTTTELFGR